ncbi:hypothetical protein CDL15_Pgr027687 [Punica granatum]|nr:hypothetical protein CDL15_Pgr027687 [Punica granatum]
MAEPRSSSPTHLYTLLGLSGGSSKASSILDISKAYKFITMKWHHDHDHKNSTSDKFKVNHSTHDAAKESSRGKNAERISSSEDATTSWEANDPSFYHRHNRSGSCIDDSFVHRRSSSFLSKSASRRSHTPTPSSFSRTASRRSNSVADFFSGGLGSLSRSASRKLGHGLSEHPEVAATTPTTPTWSASCRTPTRMMSKVGRGPPEGPTTPANASRSTSSGKTRMMSRTTSSIRGGSSTAPEAPERDTTPTVASRSASNSRMPTRTMRRTTSSVGRGRSETPSMPSGSEAITERATTTTAASRSTSTCRTPTRTMSRTTSSIKIVYSQTSARKKPQPIEMKLECTLEELLTGCIKKVTITRDVLSEAGVIQEDETLKISVEPGWRKGTKIMFEGKGDEKPGYLPADIVFVIEEKRHPLFKRRGDDLETTVDIPLVQALTGCTLSVPLLGGDKMALSFEEIIYPGYKKAISGQGMPCTKDPSRRGELRITFFVEFPLQLSEERRLEIRSILNKCDSS